MTQTKTPFEKAGYTKGSKFKTLVARCNTVAGAIVQLQEDDGSHSPFFEAVDVGERLCFWLPTEGDKRGEEEELELIVEQEVSNASYPNPPHKHAAIIAEWIKGAEIEYRVSGSEWYPAPNPTWSNHREYRVKPQKSDKDIQIEKLEAEFKVAKIEMEKFYNSYMQSFNKTVEISDKIQELKSNAQ